ncbi:MAG: hypothetical protein HOD92_19195 [Deltaproteobacteria bacterium]|jgi:hypothetical protein|nr:hypothetical protein [Deltaproteobacteria bacterium]MBT4526203.1 hypothetical protein [Deltaproteobacteria bacterium]
MAQLTNQSIKKIAIWGIPLVALLALIILLTLELTSTDEDENYSEYNENEVIQSTDPDNTGQIEIESNQQNIIFEQADSSEESDEIPVEGQIVIEQIVPPDSIEGIEAPTVGNEELSDPEMENSYIVEEGDNLWKIAKKKNVLDDAWKWKTILIQNRDKINYTIVSEETGQWKVMVDAGKRLVVKAEEGEKNKTSFKKRRKKRYALQLLSLNVSQLELAIDIVKFLIKDGYYAYLYRTREKIRSQSTGNLQYFYRIRVGFYETSNEGKKIGAEIVERYANKRLFSHDYWTVLPSYSELNGELIDFGIQRNKPFIIQLSKRDNRTDAINDLSQLTSLVDFSYISQKKVKEGGFLYRIRAGFYETREEAQKAFTNIQSQTQGLFPEARIFEIHHVMESAPGQSTGETKISKVKEKAQ